MGLLVAALTDCATGTAQVSASLLSLKPPALLVARRSPRVLYIVLDPQRVPVKLGPVKWDLSQQYLTDVDQFVRRDLAKTLGNYFERVEVVAPGFAPPLDMYVIADVKVDGLTSEVVGEFAFSVFTWAFALRPGESGDYLFSFAGQARSNPARSPQEMLRSVLENALTDLVKAYADKDVHRKVLELPTGDPPQGTPT
jgi:hypothetical protein